MKKLLRTLQFSKFCRLRIYHLSELTDFVTDFHQVIEISRCIRLINTEISEVMKRDLNLFERLELRSMRNELRKLRKKVAGKTVSTLNALDKAA